LAKLGDQPLQLDFIDELGNVTTTLDELGNVTTAFGYQALDDLGNPTTLSEFRITDDSCSNTELSITPSPSAACELTLVFEPQALGTKTFNLPIPYLDELGNPTSLEVPLSGQGVDIPIPNIGATLMSHDFEEINIGSESDVQTIRISNSGDGELNIGQVTLPNTADFILGKSRFPIRQISLCFTISVLVKLSVRIKTVRSEYSLNHKP